MLGQVYLVDTVLRLLCGFLEVTFYFWLILRLASGITLHNLLKTVHTNRVRPVEVMSFHHLPVIYMFSSIESDLLMVSQSPVLVSVIIILLFYTACIPAGHDISKKKSSQPKTKERQREIQVQIVNNPQCDCSTLLSPFSTYSWIFNPSSPITPLAHRPPPLSHTCIINKIPMELGIPPIPCD